VKIRIAAVLAGLVADFIGSILFVVVVVIVLSVVGDRLLPIVHGFPITSLLAAYWIGLAFTVFGAYVTAILSRPDCVLNTFLFGILSTLPSLLFISWYPLWFTILCILTILPVSLATARAVAVRTV
jgi:hypothetical protein